MNDHSTSRKIWERFFVVETFPDDKMQQQALPLQPEGGTSSGQTLLVVGAGPKAIALAAKREVLAKLGLPVPELVIVDFQGVAAHWSGQFGFTDGRQLLGTRPEKDIGFPYASTCWGTKEVNKMVVKRMFQLSWHSYLVEEGRYTDWIDRGRTRPTHREWATYLQWVAGRVGMRVTLAEVRSIGLSKDHKSWQLSCRSVADNSPLTIAGQGLVMTGSGTPIAIPGQPASHARVMDGASFWLHTGDFVRLRATLTSPVHIGVIGTGETAAAIVIALLNALNDLAIIEVVSPSGVLYQRDEGFEENRLFSDPDARLARLRNGHRHELTWLSMTERDRREFLRRTDRGVFSLLAMEEINRAENVRSIKGTAMQMHVADDRVSVDMEYDGKIERDEYDYVVVAIGFNALWFSDLFDEETLGYVSAATDSLSRTTIERTIGEDLSIQNLEPRLHLPMLAGVAQGPGFPNLSCLGLLADRILSSYL
jgi:mycobactin lysine-N-oxygenase